MFSRRVHRTRLVNSGGVDLLRPLFSFEYSLSNSLEWIGFIVYKRTGFATKLMELLSEKSLSM